MSAPVPKDRWAWHWECCQRCGTAGKEGKHIHKGRGLCLSCWDKKRSLNPKRVAYSRINRIRHYEKRKQNPNYKELQNQHAREWKEKYPNHYRALWHRNHLRQKFVRFIKSPVQHKYKKYEKALKFHCEDCEEMVRTCILPDYCIDAETSKAGRELRYFKKIHEHFCQKKTINYGEFIKL